MKEHLTMRQKVILERIRDGLSPLVYQDKRALNSLHDRGYWVFLDGSTERVLTDKGREWFEGRSESAASVKHDHD